MMVKKSPSSSGPRHQVRQLRQRRNLANVGLLVGAALIGSLAAGLWVRMVIF